MEIATWFLLTAYRNLPNVTDSPRRSHSSLHNKRRRTTHRTKSERYSTVG